VSLVMAELVIYWEYR